MSIPKAASQSVGSTRDEFPPLEAGALMVRLAEDESEVVASQKLRYRIFCEEMGAKANADVQAQRRDFDEFDEVCDHLLVLDNSLTGEAAVVGTYRLLRREAMERIGRFYSESEYDISKVKAQSYPVLELGRSCVDENYRNRAVMQLLWRGIGQYSSLYQIKLMFGCASFVGTDIEQHAMSLAYLYHNHLAPDRICMRALPEHYVEMNRMPKEQVDTRAAIAHMPPLIKGYLRLGGYIGDGAVIDHAYNTTDVGIMVETDLITETYFQRYAPGERDS